MANVDFEFDFDQALARAYHDVHQDISYISEGLDNKALSTEKAIRKMIEINSSVLSTVLKQYNRELLNEL